MAMFKTSRDLIHKFLGSEDDTKSDYLKRENSNFVYSLPLLRKNICNQAEEEFLLTEVLPKKLVDLYEDGVIYIHDKQLSSYCQSISCKDIAESGIKTIAKNMLESEPCSSLEVLLRHFSNIVVLMSQQVSGAVMLSQMTTVSASYLHDEETRGIHYSDKQLVRLFKSLIYELNLPLRSGSESAFSNITLEFGKASEEIKDELVIIGGDFKDYTYSSIPKIYFDRINKAIIDVMAEGTKTGIPFTFPLITIQIDDNFNYDNDLFLYLLDKMYNWGGVYFENFKTKPFSDPYYLSKNPLIKAKDPEVSRSMCPLDPTQPVLYYSDKLNKFVSSPIKEVYKSTLRSNEEIRKIICNGQVVDAKINKVCFNKFAEITLANGSKIKTTTTHLNKTLRGDNILTSDLTTDDYLPFSIKALPGTGLTFEDGVMVGAFLGDGSYSGDNNLSIVLSLNIKTDNDFIKWIKKIVPEKYGGSVSEYSCLSQISGQRECVNVRINSAYLVGLIKQFVNGSNALTKSIDLLAISMSEEFRKGIVNGLYQTDGGNNNRIYTSSVDLVDSMTTVFASLGIPVRVDEDNREDRLSTNTCYTLRWYDPNGKRTKHKDIYIMDNEYFWFKIVNIEEYTKQESTTAYCFEVLNDKDPFFMLPNGILTHNCRLNIDLNVISRAGGGIFGSSTGNVGAIQVLNLNLNRVFIEFGHDAVLLKEKIREYMEIMQEGHMAKRNFVESNRDLYPTFFAFNDNLKNYFNVFAVSGMHEALINIGYENGLLNDSGKQFAHEIMQYISGIVDEFIVRDKVACGIEYAPNENAGIKMARNDVKWAKKNGKDIFVQGTGKDVYITSGCMLPFSEEDFTLQIENSAEYQGYATSGSILHHFIEAKIEPKKLAKYLDRLFNKPINYVTFTPTMSSCMNCGQRFIATDARTIDKCHVCGSDDIATFSRVIGYVKMIARKNIKTEKTGVYRGDYNFWSKARRIDWNQRRRFAEDDSQ
jgi:anaerobic ribonucleoside-triphosphate reductase